MRANNFKCIILGDRGVGKTALFTEFTKGYTPEKTNTVILDKYYSRTVDLEIDNKVIHNNLIIWDIKDQTHFRPIDANLSQGTQGVFLVFDLSNLESFRNLPYWIENIKTNLGKHIPMVLIGNKSDLTDRKVVHVDEGAKFAGKYNMPYIEVSTKTTEGINDCFYILAFRIFKTKLLDILLKRTLFEVFPIV